MSYSFFYFSIASFSCMSYSIESLSTKIQNIAANDQYKKSVPLLFQQDS